MEMQISNQEILAKLTRLQAQVDKLQKEFEDDQLSDDEIKALDESIINEKEGRLYSLEDIENARNKV